MAPTIDSFAESRYSEGMTTTTAPAQSDGLAPADHYVELISAALEIHRPRRSPTYGQLCIECSRGGVKQVYPCPTALALGVTSA